MGLLMDHVHIVHDDVNFAPRFQALREARPTVKMPEGPWPGELDLSGLTPVNPKICCVDGCTTPATYENVYGNWLCGSCADGNPTQAEQDRQREDLSGLIAENNQALTRVRGEMDAIKTELSQLNIRAGRITTELDRPEYVRKAAQNQLLDMLIDAGQHEAATLVMRFMRDN